MSQSTAQQDLVKTKEVAKNLMKSKVTDFCEKELHESSSNLNQFRFLESDVTKHIIVETFSKLVTDILLDCSVVPSVIKANQIDNNTISLTHY